MYTGTNPKALLSITLITNAFQELLKKKKYEDINVKAICNKADISRQAFYNVFESKEEVLRKCINDIFGELLELYANNMVTSADDSIERLVQIFYKNQEFMDGIIYNHLDNILSEQLVHAISKLSRLYVNDKVDNLDYMLQFYAGGLTQVLVHWMKDENRVSTDELIQILEKQIQMPYF